MDFSAIDIHSFLKASMPVRFQDIGPYDFEKFMATLFRADGYSVQETEYSGDFGADLILTKDKKITAVQVKRYTPGALVSVGDVNQVIGATSYYKAHNALVITTSDFTAPAISLAKSTDVILWNWQRLEKYVSTVFLNGQDYHQFFGQTLPDQHDEDSELHEMFDLKLLQLEDDVESPNGEVGIEVHVGLTNLSERNLTIHIDPPIVISRKSRRQVTAIQWKENYFFHGVIVSGATVELACVFLKSQIGKIRHGDRMILQVHVASEETTVVIDEQLHNPSGNCYIVTFCYGRDSKEYREMIFWRDHVLQKTRMGRILIDFYYEQSPALIKYANRSLLTARLMRFFIKRTVCVIVSVVKR